MDPFDGGPHYGANVSQILPITQGRRLKVTEFKDASFKEQVLVATTNEEFRASLASADIRDHEVALAPKVRQLLGVELGEEVYMSPFNYNRGK